MTGAGQKLKRRREELNLRYRDVEEASQRIARKRKNGEFAIALSRLADIENKGIIPSMYRVYTLCAIYRLDLLEVLDWYGVTAASLPADAASVEIPGTHSVRFGGQLNASVAAPLVLDAGFDVRRTAFLSRIIKRWGKLPLLVLNDLEPSTYRYGYVGTDDWSMYPIIQPGALLLIDETRRKIAKSGWHSHEGRPIYFIEHRQGFAVGWCSLADKKLTVLPHPASDAQPKTYAFPEEAEITGQVVGIATRLDSSRP